MIQRVNRSIPNPIPCVLDILEVLVEDTEQPRFLPWDFNTVVFDSDFQTFVSVLTCSVVNTKV